MSTETWTTPTTRRLPEELMSSTTFLLKRVGMTVKEQSLLAFEKLGLNPYHHAILAVLDEGSTETQGAIADRLGYDRGQLVGLLDELEEQGSVERRRDPDDRRRHIVRLTSSGKATLTKARNVSAKVEREFLSSLDDEERTQLYAILRHLAEDRISLCAPVRAK